MMSLLVVTVETNRLCQVLRVEMVVIDNKINRGFTLLILLLIIMSPYKYKKIKMIISKISYFQQKSVIM